MTAIARALVVSVVALSALACATAENAAREGDLNVTLSRHHVDLRWGRVEHAARFIHPDLRAAFVEDWTRYARDFDLTDVELMQVYAHPDGKSADVTVRIGWIEKKSQRAGATTTSERWELSDGDWIATRYASLEDTTDRDP